VAYEFGVTARAIGLGNSYFLKKINFKDGDIFLDCGANVGDLKIWFELNKLKITYIGFEPSPIEFKCLKANVNPSQVHNVGLWDSEGERTLYISSQGADSSLIEPPSHDETVICKVMRLESFVHTRVKCLKLEAEGGEPEILEGLGEKLGLVEYVSADLGFERGLDEESTLVPVTNFLLARSFELVDVSHGRICALYRNTEVL
jgi:FkbM family methyltransferase